MCALVAALLLPIATAAAERLVVVESGSAPSRQQAIAGIRGVYARVEIHEAKSDNEAAIREMVASVGRDGAIVTLGTRAAALVARVMPAVPVVNCIANRSDDARVPAGTIVVPREIPIETQLQWLKRLLPDARNVGILFDPAQHGRRAAEDAAAVKRAGYAPVLEPVPGSATLPNALNRLANGVDVVLAIPDVTVFASEHSRALMLFSFRHRIPLAGPSEAWARAGSLYAVDWDYQDLGRYCASLALRQLAGGRTPPPMPAAPRMRVVVNARSAEQLRITWDAEILQTVDRVYE